MQLTVYREETHAMRLYTGSKYKVAEGLIYTIIFTNTYGERRRQSHGGQRYYYGKNPF
jgi:hypothetical protein